MVLKWTKVREYWIAVFGRIAHGPLTWSSWSAGQLWSNVLSLSEIAALQREREGYARENARILLIEHRYEPEVPHVEINDGVTTKKIQSPVIDATAFPSWW